MTVYLTIITTALAFTQVARVIQNAIHLKRQKQGLARLVDDVNDRDIARQKHVYEMLERYLQRFEADASDRLGNKR